MKQKAFVCRPSAVSLKGAKEACNGRGGSVAPPLQLAFGVIPQRP
jgi:hypothetical protein